MPEIRVFMSRSRTPDELDLDPLLGLIKETILSLSLRPKIEVYGFEIEVTGEPDDPYQWITVTHGPDDLPKEIDDATNPIGPPIPSPLYSGDTIRTAIDPLHTEFSSLNDG